MLFLVLAIACYAIGAAGPGTGLLIIGGLAELTFWVRIFRGGREQRRNRDSRLTD
jgi:hypothetical protein